MIYLSVEEIIHRNKEVILKTGGCQRAAGIPLNINSLEYLVKVVEEGIAGHQIYSSLSEKGAAYAYNIITKHIFVDGNKRTGMACSLFFMKLNNFDINATDDEIVHVANLIAQSKMDFQQTIAWFEERMQPQFVPLTYHSTLRFYSRYFM